MRPLIVSVVALLVSACAPTSAQGVALPIEPSVSGAGILNDIVSICSHSMISSTEAESAAASLNWTTRERAEPSNDRSLNLVPLAEDSSIEAEYFFADKTIPSRVGSLSVSSYQYPHLSTRTCTSEVIDFKSEINLSLLSQVESFVGQLQKHGDKQAAFGDLQEVGAFSFVTDIGDIITVDVSRSEHSFIYFQMTQYRRSAPGKE
jgi:hypothetical protein